MGRRQRRGLSGTRRGRCRLGGCVGGGSLRRDRGLMSAATHARERPRGQDERYGADDCSEDRFHSYTPFVVGMSLARACKGAHASSSTPAGRRRSGGPAWIRLVPDGLFLLWRLFTFAARRLPTAACGHGILSGCSTFARLPATISPRCSLCP